MGKEKPDVQEKEQNGVPSGLLAVSRVKSMIALSLLIGLTILFSSQLHKLKFNYSFNSFFPEGDDELEYYEQFIKEFGQYNDFLFVVLKSSTPLDTGFIQKTDNLKANLESLPQTERVISPYDLKGIQITPLSVNTYSLISRNQPPDEQKLKELNLYGNFFGRDNESIMLFLRHIEFKEKKAGDLYYQEVLKAITDSGLSDSIVSGKIQMQYDFTLKLENELGNLLIGSIIVIFLILLVLFRSIKGLILPLLVLILTLVWTMGLMALTGKSIDVMVVMIPAILLIVALSDVIHFIHKYDNQLDNGFSSKKSIYLTIRSIGKATFLTSATTAIGFLGLIFLPIKPIQEFGIFTAAGVLLAFVITFLTLPSLLFFFPNRVERKSYTQLSWTPLLTRLYERIIAYRKPILGVLALGTILIVSAIPKLTQSTSLIVGLQKNEPELQKVAYFDEFFDGYKPFELGIELDENMDLFSPEVITKLDRIESYLSNVYGVHHIQSPLTLIKEINAGIHGGARKYFSVPEAEDLNSIERVYRSRRLKSERSNVQTEDGKIIRLLGRTEDLGSGYFRPKNKELKSFLDNINGKGFSARLTGASYLIDKTDGYVVQSLLKGIGFALVSVSLFIFIFFRSWRLAILTLIPNLMPIAILFGLMGLLNVHLNISTAIIFTVALGIAIDDSIHFLARYQLEKQSHTHAKAIKNAFTGTGKSIIVTSLVIVLGFSVFLISGFSAAYYLGFFIVLAALIAVTFDLTLLPILLQKRTNKD